MSTGLGMEPVLYPIIIFVYFQKLMVIDSLSLGERER